MSVWRWYGYRQCRIPRTATIHIMISRILCSSSFVVFFSLLNQTPNERNKNEKKTVKRTKRRAKNMSKWIVYFVNNCHPLMAFLGCAFLFRFLPAKSTCFWQCFSSPNTFRIYVTVIKLSVRDFDFHKFDLLQASSFVHRITTRTTLLDCLFFGFVLNKLTEIDRYTVHPFIRVKFYQNAPCRQFP